MAKLNIKFNSGESYSFDTKTAKEKTASIQKEMQKSDPRRGASTAQKTFWYNDQNTPNFDPAMAKPEPGVMSGALKTYAGSTVNTAGTALEGLGKINTRISNAQNAEANRNAQANIARYQEMLSAAANDAERKRLELMISQNQRRLTGMQQNTAFQESLSRNAAQKIYDKADTLTSSGAQDIENAKAGMGKAGRLAVDVGVAGTQMAADMGLAAITGGSALIPMALRSFGGGTQEARQSGASFGQQLAYGAGNAAIQVGTEKMFNVATPFKKFFGEGVLDKALAKATGKLAQSAAGKAALSALGEATEEVAGDVLEPILRAATLNQKPNWDAGQMLEDAIVGGILGLGGSGVEVATQKTAEAAQRGQAGNLTSAAQTAQNAPHDAVTQIFIDSLAGKKATAPEEGTTGPVKVGKATTIYNPYQGATPVQQQVQNRMAPDVAAESVNNAVAKMKDAKIASLAAGDKGFKANLKKLYNMTFRRTTGVPVAGMVYEGKPYLVDIGSDTPGKVINDKNLSPEKLAVLDILPTIVQNADYLGSGAYVPHGNKQKQTTRFDYFETEVRIEGSPYVVSFDVEVFPNVNNYRTHRINKIELSPVSNADPGPAPGASETETAPMGRTRTSRYTMPDAPENTVPVINAQSDPPQSSSEVSISPLSANIKGNIASNSLENSGNPTQALNVENRSPQLTSKTPPEPVVSAMEPSARTSTPDTPAVQPVNAIDGSTIERPEVSSADTGQKPAANDTQTAPNGSISPPSANIKSDFLLDLVTGKKRVDQGKLTDALFEEAADHGMNIDADGKVYSPLPTNHIDRRTVETAGSRDVNAFQFDHPELHEYYKKAAESLMADADISTQFPMPRRTERTVNGKRTIQSAIDSVSLRLAMDMGLSRNQIIDAAQSLIDDHGQENYAAAKRLELVLNEMLTNGYTTVFGQEVEPNSAYIKAKADIVGSAPEKSGEELPIWDMPEANGDKMDSLGSARGGFDPYSRLQNKAGNFHDDGANAARVVDVPKTNFEGRNVPESAKTVMGARAIDGDDVRMIERQIANGTLAFDTITDESRCKSSKYHP